MNSQLQEWIALAVVFVIATISIFRWLRRRQQGGSGCAHCEQSNCTSVEKTRSEKE